ncbi:MAG TPA: SCO family protein [Opitutaceae bacterium]|jgi:protein SCO1/2
MKTSLPVFGLVLLLVSGAGARAGSDSGVKFMPALTARASIYDDAVPFQTDTGASVTLSEFRGRPVILSLFFSTCHVACPATIAELLDVSRRLPRASRIPILLVTIDPQTDTVEQLAACRTENRLPGGILLLRGHPTQVRKLAAAAGIVYRVEAARIVHRPKVVVLDSSGVVAASFPGTHANPETIVQAALQAVTEEARDFSPPSETGPKRP